MFPVSVKHDPLPCSSASAVELAAFTGKEIVRKISHKKGSFRCLSDKCDDWKRLPEGFQELPAPRANRARCHNQSR